MYFCQILLFPFKTWVKTDISFSTNMCCNACKLLTSSCKITWGWAEAEEKGEHKASIHLILFKLASYLPQNAIHILKRRNYANGYITITAPPINLHLHTSIWKKNLIISTQRSPSKHSWSILRLFSLSNLHL